MAIDQTPEWAALTGHAAEIRGTDLRALFAEDPGRAEAMTFGVGDLRIDVSRQRATLRTLELLRALAATAGVADRRAAMFHGEAINSTEHRAVLHTALRAPRDAVVLVDGRNVVADVWDVLDRMADFTRQVHGGEWTGSTGRRITTVVNIGIGGSDLGPRMACWALKSFSDRSIETRFVSNIDGSDLVETLRGVDPETVLFVVASKTFTTLETMTNARAARAWLVERLGEAAVGRHFVAVSTNHEAVSAFGIDPSAMFGFWDWVGGRYSLDSAIGLPLMLLIGPERFEEMLGGMRTVDEHVRTASPEHDVSLVVGLLGLWERNFLGSPSYAVVPYADELRLFAQYLQQLDMESNGKRVHLDGSLVTTDTGPVVWGTAGTDGQHAYFQLLHQGTTVVPVDLIGFARPVHPLGDHHLQLFANLGAQAAALAFGKTPAEVRAEGTPEELVPHRTFPGNRPTTVITAPALSPSVLGQLIALWEHRVFVQGAVWGINSFDQWGVELGKQLAKGLAPALAGEVDPERFDPATTSLVRWYRSEQG